MVKPFNKFGVDKAVALDSLGFVLGGVIAYKLKKPLVLARKGGKLPQPVDELTKVGFEDYSKRQGVVEKKFIEMKKISINKNDGILIVDEWIETGTQIKSVIKIIEELGGKVIGVAVLHADKNKNTQILFDKYNCHAVMVEEN